MTKSMNNEQPTFVESRRTFLKGTAYSVAGATLAQVQHLLQVYLKL
jgi:hypothetical protein